jgi:dephospho-CoA kinase
MRRWVVTGPAGGGKSTLCRLFAERGAAILDGDRLGHEVLGQKEIIANIAAEFGPGVVCEGAINRSALGSVVFAEASALKRLNRITHGPLAVLIGRRLAELENERQHRLAVLEAAVYFLLPPVPGIEKVITVTAPETVRLARLTGPGGLVETEAWSRIEAQGFMAEGWNSADVVLDNRGTLADLESAAEILWSGLDD